MPFLSEALKFSISAWLLRGQLRTAPEAAQMTRTWGSVMLFPIPSVIYWIHNNVQVISPQPMSRVHARYVQAQIKCCKATMLPRSGAVTMVVREDSGARVQCSS